MDTGDYHLGERGFVLGEGLPLSGDGSVCFGFRPVSSFALLSRIINNSRIRLEPRCNTHKEIKNSLPGNGLSMADFKLYQ